MGAAEAGKTGRCAAHKAVKLMCASRFNTQTTQLRIASASSIQVLSSAEPPKNGMQGRVGIKNTSSSEHEQRTVVHAVNAVGCMKIAQLQIGFWCACCCCSLRGAGRFLAKNHCRAVGTVILVGPGGSIRPCLLTGRLS